MFAHQIIIHQEINSPVVYFTHLKQAILDYNITLQTHIPFSQNSLIIPCITPPLISNSYSMEDKIKSAERLIRFLFEFNIDHLDGQSLIDFQFKSDVFIVGANKNLMPITTQSGTLRQLSELSAGTIYINGLAIRNLLSNVESICQTKGLLSILTTNSLLEKVIAMRRSLSALYINESRAPSLSILSTTPINLELHQTNQKNLFITTSSTQHQASMKRKAAELDEEIRQLTAENATLKKRYDMINSIHPSCPIESLSPSTQHEQLYYNQLRFFQESKKDVRQLECDYDHRLTTMLDLLRFKQASYDNKIRNIKTKIDNVLPPNHENTNVRKLH
ncbi:MAG: hypothetical protein A3F11_06480 [Gammaproteobacteria bacterium RIFCSPHIGHO2_12_FULL_37_14]|nr:MAG: hypothetical protein A3F11_06480 [Gammaproteobacteria bacterium RIFCSPHIGHO2_12_FULL_37_14]